jgi:hypothetical protein
MSLKSEMRNRTSLAVVLAAAIGVVVGACLVAVAAIVLLASPQGASAADQQKVQEVARKAIQIQYDMFMLPPGLASGHIGATDHANLRNNLARDLRTVFAGDAYTSRLASAQDWADRVSSKQVIVNGQARIMRLDFDGTPDISGDSAFLSGTYRVYFTNSQDIGQGTVKWGGWANMSFSMQMQQVDGKWLVSSYTEHLISSEPDPSAESGTEFLPTPGATKTAPGSVDPLPVEP